jgi:hypothetical protein
MPSFCPYARPPPSRVSVVRSLLVSIDCATQTVAGATSVAAEHRPRPEHQLPTLSPSVASQNDERPPWALLARSASRPAHICGPGPPAARRRAAWPASRRGTRPRARAVPAGHGRWPPPRRPGLGRQRAGGAAAGVGFLVWCRSSLLRLGRRARDTAACSGAADRRRARRRRQGLLRAWTGPRAAPRPWRRVPAAPAQLRHAARAGVVSARFA